MLNRTKIQLALATIAIAGLAFVWGALAFRNQLFPYNQLKSVLSSLQQSPWSGTPGVPLDMQRWNFANQFFLQFQTKAEVVMLGDSHVETMHWNEVFPGVAVFNRGIGGDTTGGVLNRLDEIIALQAAKVFIMLGVNDLQTRQSVELTLANYGKIVAELQASGAHVYIHSVLLCNEQPAGRTVCPLINPLILELNRGLQALASEQVTYIDLFPVLTDAQGLRTQYTDEGLHLNPQGYQVWSDYIAPLVTQP
jgi:lysophospholipase L1-like esterase